MAEVKSYHFTDFLQAVRNSFSNSEKARNRTYDKLDALHSIFERAAVNDNPNKTPDEILEIDDTGLASLVKKAIDVMRSTYEFGKVDQEELLEGDYVVKNNNNEYIETFKYTDGKLVKLDAES